MVWASRSLSAIAVARLSSVASGRLGAGVAAGFGGVSSAFGATFLGFFFDFGLASGTLSPVLIRASKGFNVLAIALHYQSNQYYGGPVVSKTVQNKLAAATTKTMLR